MTQQELATLAGIPKITLQQYERNVTKLPRVDQLCKIASALETSIVTLCNNGDGFFVAASNLHKSYFTYGSDERFPFVGGWTEVVAEDLYAAYAALKAFHPGRDQDIYAYSRVYSEEEFAETCMAEFGENCGHGCWERITITRELVPEPEEVK